MWVGASGRPGIAPAGEQKLVSAFEESVRIFMYTRFCAMSHCMLIALNASVAPKRYTPTIAVKCHLTIIVNQARLGRGASFDCAVTIFMFE